MSGQSTVRLDMREFQPSEYGRLAELYGTIYPDYDRSPNEFRFWDESLDRSKYLRKRYSCFDSGSNRIVGFGEIGHATWMFNPRKFWIEIWVDPAHQGRGIGSAIYKKTAEDMDELDAVMCWAMAKEDMSAPPAFLAKRG